MFTFWPEEIQQHADRIHYFNAEMGKKHKKNRVIEVKLEVANAGLYDLPEKTEATYSGTTEPFRTVSLTVPNSTPIFYIFLQDKKN